MRSLRYFFLATDTGFIIYWFVTLFHAIPDKYLFKDYENPMLIAWNWSFLPLDLLISITGFISLYFFSKKKKVWASFALISLVLTLCSGLQAIAFWILRHDFDWSWWLMNFYLLIYPCFFFKSIIQKVSGSNSL